MAARQRYRDEAFRRPEIDPLSMLAARAADAERIQALLWTAGLHRRRLEGGEAN